VQITRSSIDTMKGPADWHTHSHGRTIFVTEGVGLCQLEHVTDEQYATAPDLSA